MHFESLMSFGAIATAFVALIVALRALGIVDRKIPNSRARR